VAIGVTHDNESLQSRHGVNTSSFNKLFSDLLLLHVSKTNPASVLAHHTMSSFTIGSFMGCWAHPQTSDDSKVAPSICRRAHLEARALAGAGLLLDGHDLHDLVLQDGAEEKLHDLVLLDGHREQENVLQLLDLALQRTVMSLAASTLQPRTERACICAWRIIYALPPHRTTQ